MTYICCILTRLPIEIGIVGKGRMGYEHTDLTQIKTNNITSTQVSYMEFTELEWHVRPCQPFWQARDALPIQDPVERFCRAGLNVRIS